MKTFALILAGGSGSRFDAETLKQLVKLGGKTVLEHTLSAFEKNSSITGIVVVANSDGFARIEEIGNSFSKVLKTIKGGAERYLSTYAGLVALEGIASSDDNIVIHDAARPLVSDAVIQKCIEALQSVNALDTVIPATDTIVEVQHINGREFLKQIPDRQRLRRGQTPQGFKYNLIKDAYDQAIASPPELGFTDDCSIVMRYKPAEPILCVQGEEENIKITHPQDVFVADKLLQLKTEKTTNYASADLLKDKVIVVFGGSYGIGAEIVLLSREYGASTYSFSRSTTNTHIGDLKDVQEALESVFAQEGRIDFVVNSAAILHKQPLEFMDYASVLSQLNINYLGAVNVAIASRQYLQYTKGQLLLFTSSSYTLGRANYSLYSSTKAAVVNFTQALAEEWYSQDIRVNCICPERTRTPMRTRNFGVEPEDTLLDPKKVAQQSLDTLISSCTGSVIKVTR